MNEWTDRDWGWWPLLKLRPKKEEAMTSRLLIKMTGLFGSCSGALAWVFIRLRHDDVSLLAPGFIVACSWLFFYFGYRFTFARAWNARAAELNRQRGAEVQ